jgi:hypothetical protein
MTVAYQEPPESSPVRYRAISAWAVLSVVCGAGTVAMAFFSWLGSPLPVAAILFGRMALGKIRRAPEEYSGQILAKIGIGLGAGLGIALSMWLLFFSGGVPSGYKVLDWADLELKNGNFSPAILELADPNKRNKVYVRGYILPGRQMVRLNEFSICRTSDQCRFAIKTNRPIDLIHIVLTADRTMDYTTHEIGVGGIFKVDANSPYGTPYSLEVDYP